MKAIVQEGYGSPDVLVLRDIDKPAIGDSGVLVKVHAASVNALDWHLTRGMPYVLRLGTGLRTPRDRVRGVDVAGRVEAVGRNVTRLKPGDEVFGGSDGSFAEYAPSVEGRLALKPSALPYEQAGAFHVAALTALQGLRDKAHVQRGQTVLVNGAGGGVGTFAVQIAKWLGAQVTAVTRADSIDTVRSIGADVVIDHRVEDFTRRGERYDVIFDVGGNHPLSNCRRVLAPKGTMLVIGAPAGRWLAPVTRLVAATALSPFVRQRIAAHVAKNDWKDLALLGELAIAGHVRAVIDRQYPLSEAAEAVRHLGERHVCGKVTIKVA